MSHDPEARIRLRAFEFLEGATRRFGEMLPWKLLERGFDHDGERVPLLSQQGIFKPRALRDTPISIRTSPAGPGEAPYRDEIDASGYLSYCYRGTDPDHHQNRWLRNARDRGVPLVYFYGVEPGSYGAYWPVFVRSDDRSRLRFGIALDDEMAGTSTPRTVEDLRRYVTRQRLERLHQRSFSALVLKAYREQCTVCRLRHPPLLDAAHILPDGHPRGQPVVPNGLAMCKIHHAAFDCGILGIRPDCVVEVRADVLKEIDGPMLEHGLQRFHGQAIALPRSARARPDRVRLEERYESFRRTG
jgi:putative restriction endonuclease